MNSNNRLFCVKLVGLCSALLLTACGEQEVQEQAEVVRPAKLIVVETSNNVKNYNFPAIIEAATSSDLAFQVGGQITKFEVSPSQEVKKGDVIARLDQRQIRNELQAAQTQYDATKVEFERAARLIKEDAIARNVFDQRKSQFDVASAQLDSAKKALEDTILYSPFDGVIAAKLANDLDTVNPATPVVTVQSTGAAEAAVQIPASLVAQSKQIEPVQTFVVLDAAPEQPIEATFLEASGQADEKSQTFEVKFAFTPPESLTILPGMTGTVKSKLLFSGQDSTQISVPLNAVQSDSDGEYVWLASGDPLVVTRRDVIVGPSVGETLTIASGLEEGDEIVGAGASYLFEGMKIRRLEN